jgi:shikimate dehydrogenase
MKEKRMKKLYAVIGEPIAHSMSPQMHNDLFLHYGIDAHYQPLLVKKESLKEAVIGLKAIGIAGFNVTIPHKTNIIPFLDEIDPLAKQIGAVNTVVNQKGKLKGFNTDGIGFQMGLMRLTSNLNAKKVLIIGAGGAARAIYYTLAQSKLVAQLDICNRTKMNAEKLISEYDGKIKSKALTILEAEQELSHYQIVVQTTNIGMAPYQDELPLSLERLSKESIVSDIIYNPLETTFLREARKKGAIVQNGIDMFVNQGALAFEHWTGIAPDLERMRQNVMVQLGGKVC